MRTAVNRALTGMIIKLGYRHGHVITARHKFYCVKTVHTTTIVAIFQTGAELGKTGGGERRTPKSKQNMSTSCSRRPREIT